MGRLLLAFLAAACWSFSAASESRQERGPQRVAFEVSESTGLAFDISPDGKTVAMDLLGQIWLLPAKGGKTRPVTDAISVPAQDLAPSFSPDGRWIAFTARRPGGTGIFLMASGGGPLRRLTVGSTYAEPESAWSPDSSRLAFIKSGGITLIDVSTGTVSPVPISGLKGGPVRHPIWSPDGRRIAFVATDCGGIVAGSA